jgi:DNA-binding beta-propeller fold protein YncE
MPRVRATLLLGLLSGLVACTDGDVTADSGLLPVLAPVLADAAGVTGADSGSVVASGQSDSAAPPANVRADAGSTPQPGEGGAVVPVASDAASPSADAAPVPDAATTDAAVAGKPRLALSADFLNQTLSIFDIDKLQPGAKRADVLVGSVDLSKYSPGPLAMAVTPDGKTALVSISGGFLGAFIDLPPGNGTLLFVDLAQRAVVGELNTGKSPMGIVISPDGKRAFVGQYAENYFAVVDIAQRTFTKVVTGSQYNEELSLDDTGTVGILTYGPAGNAKTFSVADPMRVLGQTNGLNSDAAGVAFFPGTKSAYLVQAPTALTLNVGGHNVIDVTDPARPVASDNVRVNDSPTMYPVTAVGPRKSIAFPETKDNMLSLTEMKLEGGVAKKVQSVAVGSAKSLAYGVAATPDGRVLLAVPGEHYVGVVDLATQKAFSVPWEVTKSGPNDIKMIP